MYTPTTYRGPDFSDKIFINAPNVALEKAKDNGIVPEGFHATSIFPEYVKINGEWELIEQSRMDCCVVIRTGKPYAVEFRNVKKGEPVVIERTEDGAAGIYVHANGFASQEELSETFAFRTSRSRETSYSMDYDSLYELLKYEKIHGHCVWVLGPATVFDYDSRQAMEKLVDAGYVQAIFAGNALATHDMEASWYKTALGQDIYTQKSVENGHYHHLELINRVRNNGSIESFIKDNDIQDGVMAALVRNNIPYVLAGSIRDDGPLPGVIANVYEAQDKMRSQIKGATTVIALATQLHTIATGNMTPSYSTKDGVIRPVHFYTVDISEFAVNKLRDRGSLAVKSIVTNIQDFLVHIQKGLEL